MSQVEMQRQQQAEQEARKMRQAEVSFLKAQNQHLRSNNKELKQRLFSVTDREEPGAEDNYQDEEEDPDEVLFVTSAVKKQVELQQQRFEHEIVDLQERLEAIDIDNGKEQAIIVDKARALHSENQLLKETLARMKVVQPDMIGDPLSESSPHIDSEDEEIMRMRYFEALRRQHFEEQMRQRSSGNRGDFKTPNVISFNYDDFYSYGSEVNTASANYRPRNSGTHLRTKKRKDAATKAAEEEEKESAKMDPADDSFHVSPIKSEKYGTNKQVSKQQPTTDGNKTLSGVSEFDYLGGSDSQEQGQPSNKEADEMIRVIEEGDDDMQLDPTRKSLEKEFMEAAEEDADQAQSPVVSPHFPKQNDEESPEIPTFKLNPVRAYQNYLQAAKSYPRRPKKFMPSANELTMDRRELGYRDMIKRKMEGRVLHQYDHRNSADIFAPVDDADNDGQYSPGSAASPFKNRPYEGKEFKCPSTSDKVFERFHTGENVRRLRGQSQNLITNTPGQNRKIDCERELFDDFKVKLGLERPENTNMIFSPEADFRRKQIYQYKATGKDLPNFAIDHAAVANYGQQINARTHQRHARVNHESRFP